VPGFEAERCFSSFIKASDQKSLFKLESGVLLLPHQIITILSLSSSTKIFFKITSATPILK
jgi:hypothetical protein